MSSKNKSSLSTPFERWFASLKWTQQSRLSRSPRRQSARSQSAVSANIEFLEDRTLLAGTQMSTNGVETHTKIYNEGTATVALDNIFVTDSDVGEIIVATLTLADTSAGTLTVSGGATYNSGTGIWSVVGTVPAVNTALAAVSFKPVTNNDEETTIAVSIQEANLGGNIPVTGTITLDVTPVNDEPTVTNLTDTLAYIQGDASVAIKDMEVSDPDDVLTPLPSSFEMITAILTLSDITTGSLSAGSGNGEVYNEIIASGTGIWQITGTITAVNNALAAVAFIPAPLNVTSSTISVNIFDGGENSSDPQKGTITLNPTPLNLQPTTNGKETHTKPYTEGDASVDLEVIFVTDLNSPEQITATLQLTNTATGSLSSTGGVDPKYNSGTGVWTFTDTVANVNVALAALAFIPVTDNDVDTTIAVTIQDGLEHGTTAVTGTITLTVTPVNDSTTGNGEQTQSQTYTEGAATVALNDIIIADLDTGEQVTATLTLANTATGSLSSTGGVDPKYNSGTGVWTITDTVANVNIALAALAFLPDANNELDTTVTVNIADGLESPGTTPVTGTITLLVTTVNTPPTATNVTHTITYVETDTTVDIDPAIVVTDPDPGDSITVTITLANTAIGSLSATGGVDPNYNGGMGIWTITDTVANVNTALAALTFLPVTNNEQNTTLAVNITDGKSPAVTGLITLNVTSVNTQPTATNIDQTVSYAESAVIVPVPIAPAVVVTDPDTGEQITATFTLANTAIGTLSATGGVDPNYDGVTGIWTITDSVANVNIALAALSFIPIANNDIDTTIAVDIQDGGEDSTVPVTGTITLDVIDVDNAPLATNTTQTIIYLEGTTPVPISPPLGMLIVVTDPDSGEIITVTLTLADTATGALSVGSGSGETYDPLTGIWTVTGSVAEVNIALAALAFLPLFNNDVDTTIGVNITDGSNAPVTGTITLDVTPVNSAPTATNLPQIQTYPEGSNRVDLDDIVVSDPDPAEMLTVTLTLADKTLGSLTFASGNGETYAPATGIWTVSGDEATINAALADVAFIPVPGNDQDTTVAVDIRDDLEDGIQPLTGTIFLNVGNVAPVLQLNPIADIDENGVATVTGTITDPGITDTFTMEVNWGDPNSPNNSQVFNFSASPTGTQTFTITHQFLDDNPSVTTNDNYTVNVKVIDSDGDDDGAQQAVKVKNVAPALLLDPVTKIDEGGVATLSGTITDPGTLDTFKLDITWGDGATETVMLPAGTTTFNVTHQYNDDDPTGGPGGSFNISVTLTDDDSGTITKTTTVLVDNVNPTLLLNPVITIDQNGVASLNITITDPGLPDTFTLDINWGDPGSPNNIQNFNIPASGTGTQTFTLLHQYLNDGVFTVNATVTDDDTGTGTDTVSVQKIKSIIRGRVFFDNDRDGVVNADGSEPNLAGIKVFVDENNDGIRNGNERTTFTNVNGLYEFNDIYLGTHNIRVELPANNWIATTPGGVVQAVVVAAGGTVNAGNDFGLAVDDVPPITFNAAKGIVRIEGSDFGDIVEARIQGNLLVISYTIQGNTFTYSRPRNQVQRIRFLGRGGNDRFTNLTDIPSTAFGNEGDDTLRGGSAIDYFYGNAGFDRLNGADGNDYLYGGGDNDGLFGNAGFDRLFGQTGLDGLFGGSGNDILKGGNGLDFLSGQSGNDRLFGNNGDDTLLGGNDNDKLWGGNGNDVLRGQNGNDILRGGAGNDGLSGDSGNDRLHGQAGNDAHFGGPGSDILNDTQGNNSFSQNGTLPNNLIPQAPNNAASKSDALDALLSDSQLSDDLIAPETESDL